jgi:N-acetylmuramoyl-L-alanine amidase
MKIRSHPFIIAVFSACVIVLLSAGPARPSYNTEAGRAYRVAAKRLADLRKAPKKKKYRSYWLDCVRTFELVEKKYPKSPRAGDACLDRAGTYQELYRHSKYARDLDASLKTYGQCQSAYPGHPRAPEALFRIVEIALERGKDGRLAAQALSRLSRSYPRSSWTAKAKKRLKPPARTAIKTGRQAQKSGNTSGAAKGKPGPGGVVRNIRYWSGGNYTRIVIDHEKELKFQAFELKKPDRLIFDFPRARLDPSMDKGPLTVNDGILRQVRASQYASDTVRVVLDLASIKGYAAFPLRDPQRLVIDVMGETGSGGAGPGAAAGAGSPAARAPVTENGAGISLSRQLGLKIRTIAIDAGHGGRDPGAIGRGGTKEKNLTLDIAKRLAALVKEGLGCDVVMTRDRDVFIPLEERPAIARTKGADLFVSIHVNASRRRRARGIETYIQGLRASDRDAMATAARENATTAKTLGELDDELTKILTGLRMESNDEDSIHLAHAVQASLVSTVKPIQGQVADLGVKRAFFYVLINTGMPSILAEVGFLSNPAEEKLLKKGSYRQSLAEALYQGVKKYVDARKPVMAGV